MDFSHLQKLDVTTKTKPFPLYQIAGEPTLIVKPATQVNKPYFNAILRTSKKTARIIQSAGISEKMLKENRDEDRKLYPKFVIVGWEGVTDAKGKSVDFSPENCADYVQALPDWIFDEVRDFCGKDVNFLDSPQIDLDEKKGN